MSALNNKVVEVLSILSNSIDLGFTDDEVVEVVINRMIKKIGFSYGFAISVDRSAKGLELIDNSFHFDDAVNDTDSIVSQIQKNMHVFDFNLIRSVVVQKELVHFEFSKLKSIQKVCSTKEDEFQYIDVFPIISRKKVKSVLVFVGNTKISTDEDDKGVLKLLGQQIGALMHKRNVNILTEVSNRNAEFLNLLQVISNASHELDNLEELSNIALEELCKMMGWSVGFFMMPKDDESKEIFTMKGGYLAEKDNADLQKFYDVTNALEFSHEEGLVGTIVNKKGAKWFSNIEKQLDSIPQKAEFKKLPVIASFAFPILVMGEVVGVLEFYSKEKKMPDEFILKLVHQIGEQLGMMGERLKIEGLKSAKDVAEKSAEFKSQFLATMSHEIRTPMNGILGMVEILYSSTELSPKQTEYIETIKKSGEDLLTIINDVLDLSKLEAGKMNIMTEPIDIRALVKRISDLFKGKAMEKDLGLEYHIADDVPKFIDADEHRIGQVIGNLISNGIKNTVKGKVEVCVSIGKSSDQDIFVKFEIKDTGRGILKSDLPNLFQKYSQLTDAQLRKHDGSKDGTGLGLTICKNLAELMGGEIGVESEFRVGSNFWFTIKTKAVSEKDGGDHLEEKKASPLNEKNLGLSIMVVEDKTVNQKVVELMLKGFGCKVDIANNGEEALFLYKDNVGKYDLILMDIQMPIMDGIVATNELKLNFEKVPPIVGLSANGMEGDKEYYISKGLDEYISKPIRVNELHKVLKQIKNGEIECRPIVLGSHD